MVWLLDANLLVAAALDGHTQHETANVWLAREVERFATCAVTEGALLRVYLEIALDKSSASAWAALASIRAHPAHEFWEAGFSYAEVRHRGLSGRKQITDAWLAELARRRGGKLATFDKGLVSTHRDVAVLVKV